MNSSFNFSEFSKQSPKGIVVIYLNLIYRSVKLTWILLFFVVRDFYKVVNYTGGYIYLIFFLIMLVFLIRAILLYNNFQFKIDKDHFILNQGILSKTNTSIPFHRIQNINFKQNIIQQIINVFEVSIETAGSKDTEIAIKALSFKKAKALKEEILNSSSIEKEFLENLNKPLVKINIKELFKVSLTENHLHSLLLFLAVLIGFFQQIQQILDGLGETEALDGFIHENTDNVSPSFFFILIILVFLTVTAFLSSFFRVFVKHFNLVAYLKEDAFEINQGLFTKKSIVLKKLKVQNITISTNPLKRLIGIHYISFKQAISGKVSNKNKEKLIRIVGCKKDQIEKVKFNLFDASEINNSKKHFPKAYYKNRILFYTFFFLILVYIGLFLVFDHLEIFYSLVLSVPVLLFLIHKKIKKRFYKISDSLLVVGRGLVETHFTYLELFKVQNIKLHQNLFQKRKNVADIVLQTASGKLTIPCIAVEDAIAIYNKTLLKVETSKQSWM